MNAILHLAGEQPLPVFMGIRQFDCPRHMVAVTDRTCPVGESVREVCAAAGRTIDLLRVDPYDMQAAAAALESALGSTPASEWGINLTGGTKPMFAAAFRIAQTRGYPAFYIETGNRTIDWLDGTGRREPLRPVLDEVETFVRLAGYRVLPPNGGASPLDHPQGLRLLDTLWKQRRKVGGWYRILAPRTRYPGVSFTASARLEGLPATIELKGPEDGYAGTLTVGSDSVTLAPWPDIAQFACGGWMEDYLFSRVSSLLKQGQVKDMRRNLFVASDDAGEDSDPFQEFDMALCDGYTLTIVECKAGDIDQGHIQKLENLALRFGGHFGRGVLVAGRPERLERVRERVERSPNVAALSADRIVKEPACLTAARPGTVRP